MSNEIEMPIQHFKIDETKKTHLIISSLFGREAEGGAERSALNHAHFLAQNFNTIVWTAGRPDGPETERTHIGAVQILRTRLTKRYFPTDARHEHIMSKALWHLQDHFDPRNVALFRTVLDEIRPDFVHAHIIQGLGYNILREIALRDIPTVAVLHDLGFACIRTSMYRRGRNCRKLCTACRLSSLYKSHLIRGVPRLGLRSPSQANLDILNKHVDLSGVRATAQINNNRYPVPTRSRQSSSLVQLLYAGRITQEKGVAQLLSVLDELSRHYAFKITIAGHGPDETALRDVYGARPWCHFAGFVTQSDLADLLNDCDALCVPSIWQENSPGVVIHALTLGVPVISTQSGGLLELVSDRIDGLIVSEPTSQSWESVLRPFLEDPVLRNSLRHGANSGRDRFNIDRVEAEYLDFYSQIESLKDARGARTC